MHSNIYEPSFVKNLFNKMSDSYERMNFITSFGFSIIWRKQFINQLGKSNQSLEILDLLSGLGENWNFIIKNNPNSYLKALDFSEEMIKKSRLKDSVKYGNIRLYQQDILNNKLMSNHFDRIFCAFGLKTFNQEQIDFLAKTVYRTLKVNGKFSFIEISIPDNKILKFFYQFYLSKIIPILGKIFLGNPSDYKMLWIYTNNFKNSKKTKEIFEKNGLKTNYKKYFFGCASGISGIKV